MRDIRRVKVAVEKTTEAEVDIERVFPNRWNFNEQTPQVFRAVVESIRRYGNRLYPVVVRDIGRNRLEIIDGEHRWKACKQLGMKTVYVKNIGDIDERVAEELMLLLNEDRGESDVLKLSKVMDELKKEFGTEDVKKRYPFTDAELRDMDLFAKVNWEEFPDEWEKARRPQQTSVEMCDHEWEEVEVSQCTACKLVRTTPPEGEDVVDKKADA